MCSLSKAGAAVGVSIMISTNVNKLEIICKVWMMSSLSRMKHLTAFGQSFSKILSPSARACILSSKSFIQNNQLRERQASHECIVDLLVYAVTVTAASKSEYNELI